MKWNLNSKRNQTYSEHDFVSAMVNKVDGVYMAYVEGNEEMPCGRDFKSGLVECKTLKAAKDMACKMAKSWDVVFGAYFDVMRKAMYASEMGN